MTTVAQIALPLDWPSAGRDEDFLLSDSNREAFDHLRRWALWPVMATILTGPRKSGRSLLGRIFVRRTDGRLFDNAEEHEEEALFHAWNEAQTMRRPLLIIADSPPPAWDAALPDLRSRLAATPHAAIEPPDDRLIVDLAAKLLADRGIAAPPAVIQFLASRIERSHLALLAAVESLDRASLAHRRRLSVPLARIALEQTGLIARA